MQQNDVFLFLTIAILELEKSMKFFMKNLVEKKIGPPIQDVQIKATEMRTYLEETRPLKSIENVVSFEKFSELYPAFQFPLKDIEEYKDLDEKLQKNTGEIKTKLVRY